MGAQSQNLTNFTIMEILDCSNLAILLFLRWLLKKLPDFFPFFSLQPPSIHFKGFFVKIIPSYVSSWVF